MLQAKPTMASGDSRFVLLLDGPYQHLIASVLSKRGSKLRVKTIGSAEHELEVSTTAVQSLPHAPQTETQARALVHHMLWWQEPAPDRI